MLAELKSQKEDIARLGVELGRRVEEVARSLQLRERGEESAGSLQTLRESTQRELQSMAQQVESCPVLADPKWSEADIKLKPEQSTPSIQLPSTQLPPPATPPALPAQPVPTPSTPEVTEKKKEEAAGEAGRTERADKTARTLEKCSQIAQTIGTLTEINSSPVNAKSKSIEKLAIEEYKQKLIAISRSNDQLLRERSKGKAQPAEDNTRRFKLDKFYSAIEKLKEEVNEIRNISDMKQPRKDRIINAEP